jgi:alkanesulfonate monooxygenase SsuD/methylene tetrahydromethanopterin reductase-like flavin-dependent oxidoreductase (luciferase family)
MVLPVHAPLRLAEECLTVDALSGGRLRLGVGLGYRPEELAPFGVTMWQRRSRFEANLSELRRAFRGEPIGGVRVAPAPVRDGGPEVWIGATSEAGVQRAARLGDGFLCMRRSFVDVYDAARAEMGADAGRIALGHQWIVAEDPERAYANVGEHARYLYNEYRDHGAMGPVDAVPPADTPADVIRRGFFELLDADAAVTRVADELTAGPVVETVLWGMLPGEPVASAGERLEYVARRMIPRFERDPAGTEPGVRSGSH